MTNFFSSLYNKIFGPKVVSLTVHLEEQKPVDTVKLRNDIEASRTRLEKYKTKTKTKSKTSSIHSDDNYAYVTLSSPSVDTSSYDSSSYSSYSSSCDSSSSFDSGSSSSGGCDF